MRKPRQLGGTDYGIDEYVPTPQVSIRILDCDRSSRREHTLLPGWRFVAPQAKVALVNSKRS